ncbi:MAG TPA: methionine synthase [Jatrophihabitans sp.]
MIKPGAYTSIGSLPGSDPAEAAKLIVGELPLLPHLPELPERGPGADMIGRTASLLVDIPVELVSTGWRLAGHPGRDVARARDFLAWDLDALEAAAAAHTGALKLQVVGPWTLAASLELQSGHRVVSDHGAARDLAESLAEGLRLHLAEVARRLPAAQLVVQFDEPSLPAVLSGTLPTASGWGTVRAVERSVVRDTLTALLAVVPEAGRVVHCCAKDVPIPLLREAGADAISFDITLDRGAAFNDSLGEAVDAGTRLWLGVLPATDSAVAFTHGRRRIEKLWNELGFPREQLAAAVVPTPTCGLAGATPGYARRVMATLRDIGTWLLEDPDE